MYKIKRDSIFIVAKCRTNSSAHSVGETIGIYRNDGKWLSKDRTGETWRILPANLRNEYLYQVVEQYSMAQIIEFLLDGGVVRSTVNPQNISPEIMVAMVNDVFKEISVTCLEDIYWCIFKKLF